MPEKDHIMFHCKAALCHRGGSLLRDHSGSFLGCHCHPIPASIITVSGCGQHDIKKDTLSPVRRFAPLSSPRRTQRKKHRGPPGRGASPALAALSSPAAKKLILTEGRGFKCGDNSGGFARNSV